MFCPVSCVLLVLVFCPSLFTLLPLPLSPVFKVSLPGVSLILVSGSGSLSVCGVLVGLRSRDMGSSPQTLATLVFRVWIRPRFLLTVLTKAEHQCVFVCYMLPCGFWTRTKPTSLETTRIPSPEGDTRTHQKTRGPCTSAAVPRSSAAVAAILNQRKG